IFANGNMKSVLILISTFFLIHCEAASIDEFFKYHENVQDIVFTVNTSASSIYVCASLCVSSMGCSCFQYDSQQYKCHLLQPTGSLIKVPETSGYNLYCTSTVEIILYLGCYVETSPLDLDVLVSVPYSMTPKGCIDACQNLNEGFLYAGVQTGSQCWCGSKYGTHGSSTECTNACPGDNTKACGGFAKSSVYVI
ncbi:unnamed protein product, partial [Owenia fusiformis]